MFPYTDTNAVNPVNVSVCVCNEGLPTWNIYEIVEEEFIRFECHILKLSCS